MQRLHCQWHQREREIALNLFGWLTCAKRSMRLHEIQGALSIDVDRALVDFDGRKLRIDIRDLCGAMISPLHGDRIELVHPTAKQLVGSQNRLRHAADCSLGTSSNLRG